MILQLFTLIGTHEIHSIEEHSQGSDKGEDL